MDMPELVGRGAELKRLKESLEGAIEGNGSTLLIMGDAGIGKTRLVEEFKSTAIKEGVRILQGGADADAMQPFLLISRALGEGAEEPLFSESEFNTFTAVFAVDRAGLLVGTASSEEGLDPDIFAGMLSAVQDFVHDSLDRNAEQATGLGRLEYGDMKILIEHGQYLFLTAVLKGQEHVDMKDTLKQTLVEIEDEFGQVLKAWTGKMEEVEPIQQQIEKLGERRFLVKKDLEGVNLENERLRIADRVLDTLTESSTKGPCLVLLEDLHWTDDSSLFVLNYLARNIRDMPILILGTARPDESASLQTTIDKMVDEGLLEIQDLQSLGEGDLTSLINNVYEPNEFPPDFIRSLVIHCEGNPFFLIELLDQMVLEGNISRKEGNFVLVSDDISIPSSVEEVVNRKLEGLEPDALAMSEYASCIGRVFERIIALSFDSIKDTKQALEKLEHSRILVELRNMDEFSHAIIHDLIYRSVGERWKSAYHKSLGEFYEAAYKDRQDDVLYELARHYSRSNDHVKAYNYCIRAGEKAESAYAAEQAIILYELALASLPKAGLGTQADESAVSHSETLGDLYTVTGNFDTALDYYQKVMDRTGDRHIVARTRIKRSKTHEKKGDYDSALKEAEVGRDETETDTADYWMLESARGLALMRLGKYEDSIALIEKSIEGLGNFEGTEIAIANGYNHIGGNCWYTGDFERALDVFEKSLAIYESLGDTDKAGAIYNNTGLILRNIGENDKAMEYFLKAMEIFEKIGDRRRIVSAGTNISTIFDDWGEKEKMLEYTNKALELSTSIGDRYGMALSHSNLGQAHLQQVEIKKAMEHIEIGLGLYEQMGDKSGIAHAIENIARVELEKGNFERSRELGLESLKIREEIGDQMGIAMSCNIMSKLDSATGDDIKAKEWAVKSIGTCREVNLLFYIVEPLSTLAELLISEGNLDEARSSMDEAKEAVKESKIAVHEALCMKIDGLISYNKGETGKAERMFEDAISKFDKCGNTYESVKTKYEWARVSGNRDMMENVLEFYKDKEMNLWLNTVN